MPTPSRVAVTGLSGGGWQTIILSALDTRVALANPVAGFSSFVTRTQWPDKDLGDSEQTPSDLASIADYTHLDALMAPRALQLTYNAKDSCCYRGDYALGNLVQQAQPVFDLLGAGPQLGYHVNYDNGHNYERDNREAFYRFLHTRLLGGRADFDPTRDRRHRRHPRPGRADGAGPGRQRRLHVTGARHPRRRCRPRRHRAANACRRS